MGLHQQHLKEFDSTSFETQSKQNRRKDICVVQSEKEEGDSITWGHKFIFKTKGE